jgi:hypothetical protein
MIKEKQKILFILTKSQTGGLWNVQPLKSICPWQPFGAPMLSCWLWQWHTCTVYNNYVSSNLMSCSYLIDSGYWVLIVQTFYLMWRKCHYTILKLRCGSITDASYVTEMPVHNSKTET